MTCPVNCTFVYHSVIPPTHCPHCGRCLTCGGPVPYRPAYPPPKTWPETPQPWQPYRYTGPFWSTNTNTTSYVPYDKTQNYYG